MKRVTDAAARTLLLCLLATLLVCAPATAATILVDGADVAPDADGCGGGPGPAADPCNTIQAGVDAAAASDVVDVMPTVPYEEAVTVSKDGVRIQGARVGVPGQDRARGGTGETVVLAPGGSSAGFTLNGSNDTVAGFRIEGMPATPGMTAPAVAVHGNGGHVSDNVIERNAPGVVVEGSAAEVVHNAFYDNDAGSVAWGVWSVTSAPDLQVIENRFEGAGQGGVDVEGPTPIPGLDIVGNVAVGPTAGFVVTRVTDAQITENTILGGGVGIGFGAVSRLRISENTITDQTNIGIKANSISMAPPSDVVFIYGNNLSGIGDPSNSDTAAIYVDVGAPPQFLSIQDNRIAGNANSIIDPGATISAPNNWWGCNEGVSICGPPRLSNGGTVDAEPHLVLSASPPAQASAGTPVVVSADIRRNSAGAAVTLAGRVPPQLPFGFQKLDGPGSLESISAPPGGGATAVLRSEVPGTTHVRATLDAATADTSVDFVGPPAVTKGPVKDTSAPVLSRVSLKPRTFAVDRSLQATARRHRRGATLGFRLSEDATVRFSIRRLSTKRKQKRQKAHAVGALTLSGRAGANSTRFAGRVAGKWLRPGRYRATLVATDRAGNRSTAQRVSFRVASI